MLPSEVIQLGKLAKGGRVSFSQGLPYLLTDLRFVSAHLHFGLLVGGTVLLHKVDDTNRRLPDELAKRPEETLDDFVQASRHDSQRQVVVVGGKWH